jgi:hypothetical protein
MTGKDRPHDEAELTRLYRAQGDAEPDAGLDWRIRARARHAVRPSGLPRPAHWLGGLAVAASLFVVISIVTQVPPPQVELPTPSEESSQAPARLDERAVVAEPAPRPESRAVEARRREPEAAAERASADAFAPAPPPELARQRPPADDQAQAGAFSLSDRPSAEAEFDLDTDAPIPLNPELGFEPDEKAEPLDRVELEVERRLWLIERLISVGNAERARREIEAFRERFPEREMPAELLRDFERLSGDSGSG